MIAWLKEALEIGALVLAVVGVWALVGLIVAGIVHSVRESRRKKHQRPLRVASSQQQRPRFGPKERK